MRRRAEGQGEVTRATHLLRVVSLRTSTARYGGPSDTAASQARLVASERCSVSLLYGTLRGEEPDTSDEAPIVRQVSEYVRLRRGSLTWVLGMSPRLARATLREVRAADVVHVSMSREALPILATALALLLRRPVIAQPHGMLTSRSSRRHQILDLMVRPLVRRSSRVVALTTVEKDQLMDLYELPSFRVVCVGNPLVTALPETERPPEFDALFLGRIHDRKRPDVFIEAARHALVSGWSEHYAFVGPLQVDAADFEAAVASTPNLDWLGPVPRDEVGRTLLRGRVFVLPSHAEPWGNVLVAALALGRPCVVTRSAALSTRLGDAGTVVPDDDPQELARAVHDLVTDAAAYERASNAARQLYREEFSDEAVRTHLLGCLEAALNSDPADVAGSAAGRAFEG